MGKEPKKVIRNRPKHKNGKWSTADEIFWLENMVKDCVDENGVYSPCIIDELNKNNKANLDKLKCLKVAELGCMTRNYDDIYIDRLAIKDKAIELQIEIRGLMRA